MFNWLHAPSVPSAPSAEEEAAAEREVHVRDVRCHMSRGDEYWYPRRGDITKPFDDADCVKGQRWRPFLAKKRVDPFALPPLAPFAAQAAAPTLPDHIAVVETAAPTQPAIPQAAPKKRAKHFTRDPGAVDDDPSRFALPSALADYDMALTQDVLYQYARGWLPGARYDRRVDWSALTEPKDAAGALIMPPGTCGSADMRLKPHQMTVWTVLRAWAARQGSSGPKPVPLEAGALPYASDLGSLDWDDDEDLAGGGAGAKAPKDRVPIDAGERLLPTEAAAPPPPFDARRSPKGFLVYQSLGSGKTNVTMCGLQAFWNQRLADGTPRPLYVVTSKENKGQMARKGDGSSRYYTAAKGMFPGSLGALSSADFHAGYDILSFNQAGLRLGYPMSDLAEGEAPRRQLERARPDFVARFRNAVILIDEPQGMFAPLPAFRNTNGGLRQWLSGAEADGCTIVLLTATPGKSVAELFTLLNTLKRSDEQLAAADFVAPDGTANAAAFRAAVAGQVSFVDLSNNVNDFPSVAVEVVRAPMSSPHFTAWRERALADAREEAAGGAKAWAHLFNKEEYAKTSRAWSNMVYPGSKLKDEGKEGKEGKEGYARDAYKRGQAADVALYSAKLAALATRVDERAPLGKQYLYSAFGEQGIHQIGDVLEARGWTNVSGKLKPLYEAVAALRKAAGGSGGSGDALDRVQAEVDRLPGEPFRRFITTREWRDDAPAAGVGVVREEDEDDAPAKTTEQLMELDAFNALRNSAGDAVNLLVASKKFNEGLDLKAVRTMHIFEPLISVPAEQQTVGRGRRYCSHAVLEPEDRDMLVYHYFSVEPQGQADLVASIEGLEAAARAADADAADADAKAAALQQRVQLLAARAAVLSRPYKGAAEAKAEAGQEQARYTRSPLAGVSDDDAKEVKPRAKAGAGVKPRAKAGAGAGAKPRAKAGAGADVDGLVDAMSHMSIGGGYDPLADADEDVDLDLGGGAGDLLALPGAVFKGAAQAARDWWKVGPETEAAADAAAREADAHIAEVRAALFVQERAAEAAERRLADARAAGKEPDWSALVQADLARDRVRALKEQAAAQAAAAKAVAKDVKAIAGKTHADASAQAVAIQVELKLTLEKLDDEVRRASEAKTAAAATRREVAARKARVLPEWRHLLGDAERATGPVVGTGVGGRVLKRDLEAADKAAQPVMLTDALIHGISRLEYAPMKVLLQALRDAAIDCQVLHNLHARMGIQTRCAV